MRNRKIEDDEMLVTHPPAESKEKSERAATEDTAAVERQADPKVLAARLAAATDPDQRKKLIAEIQERLGNREAERIIRTVRQSGER
ncbi:MAG: hypothetical protein GY856_41945 [bacterium]|nr:hypothetical protein [bacterium]